MTLTVIAVLVWPISGAIRATFGRSHIDVGYEAAFDYEGDKIIGVSDFGQFRSRFGKTLVFLRHLVAWRIGVVKFSQPSAAKRWKTLTIASTVWRRWLHSLPSGAVQLTCCLTIFPDHPDWAFRWVYANSLGRNMAQTFAAIRLVTAPTRIWLPAARKVVAWGLGGLYDAGSQTPHIHEISIYGLAINGAK